MLVCSWGCGGGRAPVGQGASLRGCREQRHLHGRLGTLGGASSQANGINDRGQIVGWAETRSGTTHAFLWENGRMRDLGVPPGSDNSSAVAITNSGLVAGVASKKVPCVGWTPRPGHVVVWQNGRIRDLGVPWNPSPNAATSVEALNEHGEIVVTTADEYVSANGRVFTERSFLWDGSSLRLLPPRNARSQAVDINGAGQVIGWTYRSDFRGVTWKAGQTRLLPLPPSRKGAFTSAINDKGEVVGYGWANREVDNHAILWRTGTVVDLGTLGGRESEAVAISNRSQIVGTSETASSTGENPTWDAFLWQNGQMIDLGAGYPAAINDRGQIIGSTASYGTYPNDGHASVWLPG
jgi:probable HAF family extracellular repeat protein